MVKASHTHSRAKELLALGKTLRELRLENHYSQEALADEIGIDRSYYGGIERGEHNVALINLLKIRSDQPILETYLDAHDYSAKEYLARYVWSLDS